MLQVHATHAAAIFILLRYYGTHIADEFLRRRLASLFSYMMLIARVLMAPAGQLMTARDIAVQLQEKACRVPQACRPEISMLFLMAQEISLRHAELFSYSIGLLYAVFHAPRQA